MRVSNKRPQFVYDRFDVKLYVSLHYVYSCIIFVYIYIISYMNCMSIYVPCPRVKRHRCGKPMVSLGKWSTNGVCSTSIHISVPTRMQQPSYDPRASVTAHLHGRIDGVALQHVRAVADLQRQLANQGAGSIQVIFLDWIFHSPTSQPVVGVPPLMKTPKHWGIEWEDHGDIWHQCI